MGNLKINWRRAALLFGGWTLVSVIFAAISYAAAIGENNKEFGFVSALRLNLVQFYLWAILSPLLFRFSRRFPIEFRPLNLRNLLLYFPALISFAGIPSGHSPGRPLVHYPAVEATVPRPHRLLPRLFRVRLLYRFDYRFANRNRGTCATLLSKLSGERVGAIISQIPTRPGAAQSPENAASSAFSFQHAALHLITRFGRPAKSKQHDRAARRLPQINPRKLQPAASQPQRRD